MTSSERDRPVKKILKFFSRNFILETDQAVFEDDEHMNSVANDLTAFLFGSTKVTNTHGKHVRKYTTFPAQIYSPFESPSRRSKLSLRQQTTQNILQASKYRQEPLRLPKTSPNLHSSCTHK